MLDRIDKSSLIFKAISDMKELTDIDTWYSKVEKMKELFNITRIRCKPIKAGGVIDKKVQSKGPVWYDMLGQSTKNFGIRRI